MIEIKPPVEPGRVPLRSFVLRSGRVSRAQALSYEKLSSRFIIPFSEKTWNPAGDFGNDKPLTIEIGFGMGSATAEIAEANPEKNYLGIEVFRAGVGKLLWEIERRGLSNVRIIEKDAVFILETMIAPESAEAFHLFFPDPWPKKRHHKRRLVQRPFTGLLASRLVRGGYIYMVSDWEDYASFALSELSATDGLVNPFAAAFAGDGSPAGFAPKQEWRPETKFEKKGLEKNHKIREIFFEKKT